MDIRLLGPMQLRLRDRVVDAGPPQQRKLLAALAVDAGRPVAAAVLVDRVWDKAPPSGAHAALYSHISRLRRLLHTGDEGGGDRPGTGAADQPPVRLVRRAAGYVLELDPQQVDLHRFRHLAATARQAESTDTERANLLDEALRLWSGPPLADLPGEWAARMRTGWQQERLDAAVQWADACLRLGRSEQMIGPVRQLLDDYPLAEPLVEILMRALAAAGRDAEALDCYAAMRARLADELGVEPGPQLRAVHQALLRGELDRPASPAAPSPPAVAAAPPVVPAQLPADVGAFTGRQAELAALDRLLIPGDGADGAGGHAALVISAVSGTGGVGKTALAVRWAHRARGSFPDGQLYVNLRGYDPQQPVSPGDALTRFLNALGVTGTDVPLDEDERAARYRTATAGRRMLIVLDNASTADQVRPLLPGTDSCVVVVTSRDSLSGLVALHGAHRLELDRLPIAEAVALLRRLLGSRVDAEPAAAVTLAEQCARLPLALRVAADLAATQPARPLAGLVADLADQQRRLDLLNAGGDARAAVRAVFSWSYQHLSAEAARAFRLLGLQPGPDIDAYAAAALLDTDLPHAHRLLDALALAHLIEPTTPGRHGMHDLLRAYAADLATGHDSETDRNTALTRLFDHYLATAAAAMDALFPAGADRRPRIAPPATPVPPVSDEAAALAWLDGNRQTLVAVCTHTATHGWPHHATRLAHTLYRYYADGNHYLQMFTTHTQALAAAGQVGDRGAQAHTLNSLAIANLRMSEYHKAIEQLTQALDISRELGDRYGQARALGNLGATRQQLGELSPAADYCHQSLAVYRDIGDRVGEARSLGNLGLIYTQLGRYETAAEVSQQALAIYREIGDRAGEAITLGNLGAAYARQGRYSRATEHLRQALTLSRQVGIRDPQADALTDLGDIHTALGQYGTAADHHRQALAIFEEIGSRYGQAKALNGLGEAGRAAGRPREAIIDHTAALDIAVDSGDRDPQARAHTGLGHAHQALGDLDRARHHWHQALALYTELGVPEAAAVRAQLAALDDRARRN
jgi:DNA-binding SARP family transcriptional activator/Tfp pilus assembly protein PilF